MYRYNAIKSLFKKHPGTPVLRMPASRYPFALTKFQRNIVTESTTGLLKKRKRLYSSIFFPTSHEPTSEKCPELLLPGPVKYIERVTPTITKSELNEYFYPLFCRGWEITRLETNDHISDPVRDNLALFEILSQVHASPFLVRKFRFKGHRSARAFLQETFRIESKEKHHISLNLRSEMWPVITIMTQTHSSRRFDTDIESDRVTTTHWTQPGLTLRDIRIAVLLENLFDSSDNHIARIYDLEEQHDSIDRTAKWENLLSQYPFTD